MIFLVARTETPLAPTPVCMYLNMRNFTLSWASIREEIRMFLAFSVLLSRRFLLLPHCFTTAMLVESLLAPTAAVLLQTGLISQDWQVTADFFVKFCTS